jgi:hypothetical protein
MPRRSDDTRQVVTIVTVGSCRSAGQLVSWSTGCIVCVVFCSSILLAHLNGEAATGVTLAVCELEVTQLYLSCLVSLCQLCHVYSNHAVMALG